LVPAIREIVRQLDPQTAPDRIATMEEIISNSILQPRFYAGMFGLFALMAGTLAVVGIYGGIAFAVSSRTREIGIRMALGASRYQVFRAIAGDMLLLAAVGIAAGVAGGAILTRYLEQMLFDLTPLDPAVFIAMPVVLAGAVGAAARVGRALQQRRAGWGFIGVQTSAADTARRWNGHEALPARQPVHAEMMVKCDDTVEAGALGRTDEHRVCKVHWQIAVLRHQRLYLSEIGRRNLDQLERPVVDHVAQRLDAGRRVGQQVHGLGEGRPHGQQRAPDALECFHAGQVIRVVRIEQRDERAGVNESAVHDACGGRARGSAHACRTTRRGRPTG
jgi:hypothetical protein